MSRLRVRALAEPARGVMGEVVCLVMVLVLVAVTIEAPRAASGGRPRLIGAAA